MKHIKKIIPIIKNQKMSLNKLLLLIAFTLCFTHETSAQKKTAYIEVSVFSGLFTAKCRALIFTGADSILYSKLLPQKDSIANARFRGRVDILNLMHSYGWTLVSSSFLGSDTRNDIFYFKKEYDE
jgi:hypothetical protein